MNRETFFRGKDSASWVYGDLIHVNGSTLIKPYLDMAFPVQPETVGQYTGLKDRNGNRIFEGDIVRFSFGNRYSSKKENEKIRIGRIYFNEFRACWAIAMGRNGSDCCNMDLTSYQKYACYTLYNEIQYENRVEVIGNIHDNPELISKIKEDNE